MRVLPVLMALAVAVLMAVPGVRAVNTDSSPWQFAHPIEDKANASWTVVGGGANISDSTDEWVPDSISLGVGPGAKTIVNLVYAQVRYYPLEASAAPSDSPYTQAVAFRIGAVGGGALERAALSLDYCSSGTPGSGEIWTMTIANVPRGTWTTYIFGFTYANLADPSDVCFSIAAGNLALGETLYFDWTELRLGPSGGIGGDGTDPASFALPLSIFVLIAMFSIRRKDGSHGD